MTLTLKTVAAEQAGQPFPFITQSPLRSRKPYGEDASILEPAGVTGKCGTAQPECFHDLNLDQIAAAMMAGRERFKLEDFIWAGPLPGDTIRYRQEVVKDLQNADVLAIVRAFGAGMKELREKLELVEKLRYQQQKNAWFLKAASLYRSVLIELDAALRPLSLKSDGLIAVHGFLAEHISSDQFRMLSNEIDHAAAGLESIRYVFQVKDASVSVFRFDAEEDYGVEIARVFQRFRTGNVDRPKFEIPDFVEMDHVEANILEGVRQLYPETFNELQGFFERHQALVHPTIARFDRELQFYLGYIDYIAPLKAAGLAFCYPQLDETETKIRADSTFDLALAKKLAAEEQPIVTNDFALGEGERIFVVSGPNQGGKTTFARTFGQLHYLAGLGLPVPGAQANLLLFDNLFTHFEREENIHNLRGKLQDDLFRIHAILQRSTSRSIVIMNEIFTSTTLRDALFLGTRILQKIIDLGSLAVCVTFIDELSRLAPATVSLVSTVDPENPASRTFKIVRRAADGRAHAMAIAEKYRLTSSALNERLQS
ncbi:MutS-related protein [Rhizobium sp. SYY.PMSO]|uniref:MutS-related protein n=1 Tax=Rhizobium sp. SYY.PMSO TaxID=3382192 RepID=UPI00398FA167